MNALKSCTTYVHIDKIVSNSICDSIVSSDDHHNHGCALILSAQIIARDVAFTSVTL